MRNIIKKKLFGMFIAVLTLVVASISVLSVGAASTSYSSSHKLTNGYSVRLNGSITASNVKVTTTITNGGAGDMNINGTILYYNDRNRTEKFNKQEHPIYTSSRSNTLVFANNVHNSQAKRYIKKVETIHRTCSKNLGINWYR